ncbi:MAG: SCO family protein [Geminicoccaceae bacterium]
MPGVGLARWAGLAVGLFASVAAVAAGRADFRLVDAAGHPYSLASFPPNAVLALYFGYTTCLRACPVALDNIAAALDGLGADAASVRPVFVDLDPERVDPVNLTLYMQTFGPSFLGLTGSPEALAAATRSFAVEVDRLQFSADPADYAMTHLSPIFVLRPGDPEPLALPATSTPEALEAAFRQALVAKPL